MEPRDLATLLTHLRTEAGMSMEDLHRRSGVAVRTLYEWQAGESLNGAAAYLSALEAVGVRIRVVRNSAQVLLRFEHESR